MTLTKISILEYALREGGGGHSKAYSMYAFINVDNCERPLSDVVGIRISGLVNILVYQYSSHVGLHIVFIRQWQVNQDTLY